MTYDLVFVQDHDPTPRDVGENLFISGLPTNPKVFALYYPGTSPADEVVERLRGLGHSTGSNLFVNIGSLADPHYRRAVRQFSLRRLPVIVVTAISPLAATPDGKTAFVRLDGSSLFERPGELVETVESLFNLFLAGKVTEAAWTAWRGQGSAALVDAARRMWAIIQPLAAWVGSRELSFEFASIKILVKESGRG